MIKNLLNGQNRHVHHHTCQKKMISLKDKMIQDYQHRHKSLQVMQQLLDIGLFIFLKQRILSCTNSLRDLMKSYLKKIVITQIYGLSITQRMFQAEHILIGRQEISDWEHLQKLKIGQILISNNIYTIQW